MKRALLLLLAIAAMLGLRAAGVGEWLTLDTLRQHRAALTGWVTAHLLLAMLAYVAGYIAAVALSVPGAVFLTLTGGFLFGALLGTVLSTLGASIGAVLVFGFARAIFGEAALDRFSARGLAENIRRNAWSYLLVLRLVPLFPFFLVNLVPAFCGVRLRVFAATTLVGIIPATAVFSTAGAGLGEVLDAGGALDLSSILTPRIIAALLGLAALSLAAIPLRARFASTPPPRA